MANLVKKLLILIVLLIALALIIQPVSAYITDYGIVDVCLYSTTPKLNHTINATDAYIGYPVYFIIHLTNFWDQPAFINGTVNIYDSSSNYVGNVTIPNTFLQSCHSIYILLTWDSTGHDPGIYYAFSNISYGSGYSIAVDDFELFEMPSPPPPPPPPPAGGGGGAGAAPGGPRRSCNFFTYSLYDKMERNYFLFPCDGVIIENGVEVFTVMSEVGEGYIYLVIYEDDPTVNRKMWIPLAGRLILDVNNDGDDDLEIVYEQMMADNLASVTYRPIIPPEKPLILAPEILLPKLVILVKEWPWWVLVLLAILIITIILLIHYWRQMKKSYRRCANPK